MRNAADIKKEDNLNFILPMKYSLGSDIHIKESSVIVIIHLHYKDTLNCYMDYIRNIPKDIKIIFTASDSEMVAMINQLISSWRSNYQIITKENRGRDISAFLVACRSEILKYDYCCFLHDKKEKKLYTSERYTKMGSMSMGKHCWKRSVYSKCSKNFCIKSPVRCWCSGSTNNITATL